MGLFDGLKNGATEPLEKDPAGGEVEPNLIPALGPTPDRVGLYGDFGAREEAHLVSEAESANLAALLRSTYDGLAQLEIAVRKLLKRTVVLGPYVWTVNDSKITFELPDDRIPTNGKIGRLIPILTDASAPPEAITVTDLLPIAFQFLPPAALQSGVVDSVGIDMGIPFKSRSITLTKHGGGNFTSTGMLYLEIVEDNLL